MLVFIVAGLDVYVCIRLYPSTQESYWIINSLRVYTNAYLQAGELSAALPARGRPGVLGSAAVGLGVVAVVLASSLL